MTLVEMHVKWSVILADRLGPEILTMLEIKGHVLHRVRAHLKVPGWLLDLNALQTRKLLMFLLRLNEVSGGRGNMCLVLKGFEIQTPWYIQRNVKPSRGGKKNCMGTSSFQALSCSVQ